MVTKKKVLAIPEGDIFLRRDTAILEKHFTVRTVPGFKPGLIRKKLIRSGPIVLKLFKGTLILPIAWSCGFLHELFVPTRQPEQRSHKKEK